MRNNAFWLITALWVLQSSFTVLYKRDDRSYIEHYKDIAIQEMQRTGIPASIKLAQAIQESGAGTSELAVNANNHFGIKCGGGWTGATYEKIDDDLDAFGKPIKSCFRVYASAEQSFVEHSAFLLDPKKQSRYGFLFQIPATDYRAWANGLVEARYATDPNYAVRLIDLIERYQLYQYDGKGGNNPPITGRPAETNYLITNDVKYVFAQANETLSQLAQRTSTSVDDLLVYNENFTSANQSLNANTRVYVQHKRNAYRGAQTYHTVASGETMFDIAQLYGVKLDKLLERNHLEAGMEPAAGVAIKLRGSKVSRRPALASKTQTPVKSDSDYLFEEPITPKPTEAKPATRTEESFDGPDRFQQPEVVKPPAPATNAVANYHTVKAGDTLWNISQRYNKTVAELQKLNQLNSTNIAIGMQLRVR